MSLYLLESGVVSTKIVGILCVVEHGAPTDNDIGLYVFVGLRCYMICYVC